MQPKLTAVNFKTWHTLKWIKIDNCIINIKLFVVTE